MEDELKCRPHRLYSYHLWYMLNEALNCFQWHSFYSSQYVIVRNAPNKSYFLFLAISFLLLTKVFLQGSQIIEVKSLSQASHEVQSKHQHHAVIEAPGQDPGPSFIVHSNDKKISLEDIKLVRLPAICFIGISQNLNSGNCQMIQWYITVFYYLLYFFILLIAYYWFSFRSSI